MKRRNKFSFRKSLFSLYRDSFNYIKDIRRFIFFMIIVFFVFVAVGFFIPAPIEVQQAIMKFIQELLERTQNMNQSELTSFIFFNNLQSSFFGMTLGIFIGIFPIITAAINGYLLGYVALTTTNAESILSLWRIFPHGIFELPAVFISLGMGFKFGTFILQKEKINSFRDYFINSLKVFALVVIPLLIIAAIIEGWLIFVFK